MLLDVLQKFNNPSINLTPFEQNRKLILEKLIAQAVSMERKRELDLYKRYASDPDFKRSFDATIARIISKGDQNLNQLGNILT